MTEVDRIQKLLRETKAGEKGWRKVLVRAEGSYSRTLAEKNLSRLAALHEALLSQLRIANARLQSTIDPTKRHQPAS